MDEVTREKKRSMRDEGQKLNEKEEERKRRTARCPVTCDVADDLFCLKASLREAPLTSNHSGYGSNTTNQVEDRNGLRLLKTVCNATGTLKSNQ